MPKDSQHLAAPAGAEPDRPADLQIRYLTLGGAYVDVTGPGGDHCRWTCHGCKDGPTYAYRDYLHVMRSEAAHHAATCRAIPLT
ncbi:hypothetical protein [Streptomyces youssoufiensis]